MRGRGLRFYAPEGGGSGGGGGGSSSSGGGQQNGGGNGDGGAGAIKTPFDDLPWDELDDASRPKFEKAKADFIATLQENKKLSTDLTKTVEQAKGFQSAADKAAAELARWKPREQEKDDPYLIAVKEELAGAGYSAKEAESMGPVFANMFRRIGGMQRTEIGKDLAPLAGTVLAQEANSSFEAAYGQDRVGMLQHPEVAQVTWDHVKARVEAGQSTTPDIVLNLAKMAYVDFLADKKAKGEEVPEIKLSSTPPIPGMRTGSTYPSMGGVQPIAHTPPDPNAARTVLNEDTRNALAQTFRQMAPDLGVLPKAFGGKGRAANNGGGR